MPTPSSHPIPPGMHSVTPHLSCANAVQAIDFYVAALGAEALSRLMSPDGSRLMHAMLRIGDSMVMLADVCPQGGMPGPQPGQPPTVVMHLYVPDVDAAIEKAVAAGATVAMPATDMFWGDRYGQVTDPYGHRWAIATHKQDLSHEEMCAAMKEQFSGN